jgi:hypothetical protein
MAILTSILTVITNPPASRVGYLSSVGLVVMDIFVGKISTRLEEDTPKESEDWAKLGLCHTADERCDVLLDFGATLYTAMKHYDRIPRTLEEGMAEGRRYADLMLRMEDTEYLNSWLMIL